MDYVYLKWFVCFYEVVFRGNNERTLLCCTPIATQYTTHFTHNKRDNESNFIVLGTGADIWQACILNVYTIYRTFYNRINLIRIF